MTQPAIYSRNSFDTNNVLNTSEHSLLEGLDTIIGAFNSFIKKIKRIKSIKEFQEVFNIINDLKLLSQLSDEEKFNLLYQEIKQKCKKSLNV